MTDEPKYGTTARLDERLHPDEPWFTLRAQDIFAPYAVREYASFLRAYAAGLQANRAEPDQRLTLGGQDAEIAGLRMMAEECETRAAEMLQWQASHPERVKVPD